MKSSSLLIVLAVLVAGALVAFAAVKSGTGPSPYDAFAQCLTEKNVTMYGAWWCPHCQAQKKVFGSAFRHVQYVECSNPDKSMNQTCIDAGVTGYPFWKFADGTALSGEQTLETLAEKAACEVSPTTEAADTDTPVTN